MCFSWPRGIWEFGNLGIWEFGNFGNLGIWGFGDLGIWGFGDFVVYDVLYDSRTHDSRGDEVLLAKVMVSTVSFRGNRRVVGHS